jgi:hypothetical protein
LRCSSILLNSLESFSIDKDGRAREICIACSLVPRVVIDAIETLLIQDAVEVN